MDTENEEIQIDLRNLTLSDYDDLKDSMEEAYASLDSKPWKKDQIKRLLRLFPEGQICIVVNGQVVGVALTIIVDYKKIGDKHTYKQITNHYKFDTHAPHGDVLYGIEVFVHPDFRGKRLARRMYDARKALCERLNLRSIVAGGRIPGYIKYADELTPKEYIEKVKHKEIYDPILTFQLSNGFYVKRVLKDYLMIDHESKGNATLIEWPNIFYEEEEETLLNQMPSKVRLGLVQWQMRSVHDLEALTHQIEFFVDVVRAC